MSLEPSTRAWPLPRVPAARVPAAVITVPAAFAVAFTAAVLIGFHQGAKEFYYDSGGYWMLGNGFSDRAGHFSFLNFNSSLRGYLLPYILREWSIHFTNHYNWDPSRAVKVLNALVFSGVGTVLAPAFAHAMFPEQRWGTWRRVGLMALLLAFWSGYLAFPLTDVPGLALVLLALVAISRAPNPVWTLVAGLAAAAAINLRPAYLLLGPIVLVLFLWSGREHRRAAPRRTARWLLCLALLTGGFALVSAPQSLSAHRWYHTWSFISGAPENLSNYQLTSGMQMQRYETLVAPGLIGGQVYDDGPGLTLLSEQRGGTIEGAGQYVKLVIAHPWTMGGLFLRHAVNGLDQRYTTPYPEKLDERWMSPLRALGLLLAFLALLRLAWPAARRRLGPARWRYVVALPLCVATSLASAMETRFMLPVYLMSYLLVLGGGWPNPLGPREAGLRRFRTPVLIAAGCAACMLVALAIVTNATNNLHFSIS